MKLIKFVLLPLLFVSCSSFIVSEDEVARVVSPTHEYEAILIETNGGATTSFGYKIFVVQRGRKYRNDNQVVFLYGAARNQNACGVNLKWSTPTSLDIEYLQAISKKVLKNNIVTDGTELKITLKAGINDPTAPSGGMLYNLNIKRKT